MQIHKTGTKTFYSYKGLKYINDWIDDFKNNENPIGFLSCKVNDFQNQNKIYIASTKEQIPVGAKCINVIAQNLFPSCIYFSVRKVIPADWLNDRDQFLYPNALWENDKLFHSDCLAYSLFHGSNNIQSGFGVNHWIPFSEEEVGASGLFKSHFMVDFISGKLTPSFPRRRESPNPCDEAQEASEGSNAPSPKEQPAGCSRLRGNDGESSPLEFSPQAKDLFTCGRKLWQYYHQEARNDENYLNDASFYDIRRYFQGVNEKGQMKQKSSDAEYNELISDLRKALKKLGEERIVEKVFEYGFLLR